MLTNRRLQRSAKPFSLFHLHCFYLKTCCFSSPLLPFILTQPKNPGPDLSSVETRVHVPEQTHTHTKSTFASHPCLITLKRSGVHVVTYCMLTTKSNQSNQAEIRLQYVCSDKVQHLLIPHTDKFFIEFTCV